MIVQVSKIYPSKKRKFKQTNFNKIKLSNFYPIKKKNKVPGSDTFTWEMYQTLKN